jgi:hypothetical protein
MLVWLKEIVEVATLVVELVACSDNLMADQTVVSTVSRSVP